MILSLTYGYDADGPDDRNVYVVKKMAQLASITTLPGALLVNSLPFFEYTHHFWRSRCSVTICLSAIHPRVVAVVQLQTACPLGLHYWAGGCARTDGVR